MLAAAENQIIYTIFFLVARMFLQLVSILF
jgi:hypothetical protein